MDPFEHVFLTLLLQLAAIVVAARVGAWCFSRLGQPEVVGEILAGMILGPTVLGRFAPAWFQLSTTGDVDTATRALSELGLVLLMFLIGLEFDFSHLRQVGRTSGAVALAGVLLPFALGAWVAWVIHPWVAAESPRLGFILFLATATSITAIPILGRIMMELRFQRSRLAALTITAAAVDDVIGWTLLALVSSIVRGGGVGAPQAARFALLVALVLATVFVLRPLGAAALRRWARLPDGSLTLGGAAAVIVAVLLMAAATNALGVFSIIGPFVLGAALSSERWLAESVAKQWRTLVFALLLPVFFTRTGLRTNVGALDTPALWAAYGLIVAASMAGKLVGCGAAARLTGATWRESGCVAVMMNTRALMGLIAANIGRGLGVIPDTVFSMLVLTAILTTVMTTPLLRRMLPPELRAGGPEGGPTVDIVGGSGE